MTDNAIGAYRLLVELAEFDRTAARPGDWLNYHAALAALTKMVGQTTSSMILNTGDPQGLLAVEAELGPIVEDLQSVVRQYAADKIQPLKVTVQIAATPKGLLAHGDTRDVAILAAVMLLTTPDHPPIGICPEDDRLFVRVRRQRYCSRRCVNRANARDRRAAMFERGGKKTTSKKRRTR
jgi:hypothetical protein